MLPFMWSWIKYFTSKENWGNYLKVSPLLIFVLDMIRHRSGKAINVHCAYDTRGHAETSRHYLGLAVDFHFEGCNANVPLESLFEVLESLKIPFGLGYYKDWNSKGYHIDIYRDKTTYWVHDETGYTYYATKQAFLKDLGL